MKNIFLLLGALSFHEMLANASSSVSKTKVSSTSFVSKTFKKKGYINLEGAQTKSKNVNKAIHLLREEVRKFEELQSNLHKIINDSSLSDAEKTGQLSTLQREANILQAKIKSGEEKIHLLVKKTFEEFASKIFKERPYSKILIYPLNSTVYSDKHLTQNFDDLSDAFLLELEKAFKNFTF